MIVSHEFWLNLIAYLTTGLIAIITVTWKISLLATKDELREKVKERNYAIDRVYERFDQFKRETKEEYVRKDMCGTLHITAKDELKRIDEEYKNFRHEIRNAVQHLTDKMDELKEMFQKR